MAVVIVAPLSAALVGLPLYIEARRTLEYDVVAHLVGAAEKVAETFRPDDVLEGRTDQVLATLDALRTDARLDAAWVAFPDGRTLGTARAVPEGEAVLAEAMTGEPVWTRPYRDEDGEWVQAAYAPLDLQEDGTEDAAIAVVGRSDTFASLDRLSKVFVVGGIAWLAVVAAVGWAIASTVARPLEGLLDVVRRVEAGERPPASVPTGIEEVETLRGALLRMSDAVATRESWLRALTGAVAHEVRNPAHAARLHLGLLRRDLGDGAPPGVAARTELVDQEIGRIEDIVDSFVAFARDRRAAVKEVSVGPWLRSVLPSTPVAAPDEVVWIDPVLLGRAVANLVRNANQAGGRPDVVATVDRGRLSIRVSDDGPGFRPDVVGTAFQPFVSTRPDGSGLGLAIVAAVAEAHGGRAHIVHSGPGRTEVAIDVSAVG